MEGTQGRFLVVDDEAIIRHSYDRVLSDAGYEVEAVESGQSAIAALRANHYDGLFADLRMPDMSGIEVTKFAKQTRPEVPVVIITGYPSSATAQEAVAEGAIMYRAKPVTPNQLVDLAKTTLEVARARAFAAPAVAELETDEDRTEAPAVPAPTVEAPTVEAAPETPAEERRESRLRRTFKSLGMLLAAPVIGGFFVLLMPFVAFFVLGGVGLKAVGLKVGFLGE